jgi:hypothetical protein
VAEDRLDVIADSLVEHRCERAADASLVVDTGELKRGGAAEPRRIEVLMGDRIAPRIDVLEMSPPSRVPGVQRIDLQPKSIPRRRKSAPRFEGVGLPKSNFRPSVRLARKTARSDEGWTALASTSAASD